ncbi:hypothetical protein OQA88_7529 [Cercophora sp. LCS_1]
MATNGVNHEDYTATAQQAEKSAGTQKDLAKDEVGWYFVEQYYTTLGKSPEKIHLFYGKNSQFVYGREAEVAPVAHGRSAIQERIKSLEFQECKVRISNVDSQGSEEHILIQVIGEISNKGEESRKFVQTFVLAKQPSGYFVLNDILRYINDDIEEETEEVAPAEISEAPGAPEVEEQVEPEAAIAEEPTKDVEPVELDAVVADQKVEEAASVEETPAPAEVTAPEPATETPEPAKEAEPTPDPVKVAEEVAEEESKKPEEPKDPAPTPAAPAPTPAPVVAQPEKPKEPPKPMTWASRAAAAAGPVRPVVPLAKTATPPARAAAPPPAAAPAQPSPKQPAAAPAAAAPAVAPAASALTKDQGNEWQTAETKRAGRPQSISAAGPPEKEGAMAYIKFVTDKVREDDLRNALQAFGELEYFDINRQKNCAFVEFKTQAGYNAAVAANPHTVNGESVVVEQRRPKANAYGGSNYNATRGGAAGRGRGGFEGNRTSSQGSGRGGFSGQSRGRGGGAPRGRGQSAVAS